MPAEIFVHVLNIFLYIGIALLVFFFVRSLRKKRNASGK
jgi:hypothetical protein